MQRWLQRVALDLVRRRFHGVRWYAVASGGASGERTGEAAQRRRSLREAGRSRLLERLERVQLERQTTSERTRNDQAGDVGGASPHKPLLDAVGAHERDQVLPRRVVSRSLLGLVATDRGASSALLSDLETESTSLETPQSLRSVRRPWHSRKSRLLESVGEPEQPPARLRRPRRLREEADAETPGRARRRSRRSTWQLEVRSAPPSVSLLPRSVREEQARIASSMLERDGPAAVETIRALDQELRAVLAKDLQRQRRRKIGKYLVYKNRYVPWGTFREERFHTEDLWVTHALRAAQSVLAEAHAQRRTQLGSSSADRPLWLDSVVEDLFPKARSIQEILLMIRLLRRSVQQIRKLPAETRQLIFAKESGPMREALKLW
ncbi:hypothetical protein F1559_004338 [Cyanidiococcus yangmingshanensis]|uniref:Uncharacterized protein n=1 Tax=Cyanidiococcus yangmingshanensis TaxID=2690220 RepID=A0A7J7IHW3_9RHOD|nr:hypothetical protein F1559_004338 [Cyanidiococcus yangmingshanensis]